MADKVLVVDDDKAILTMLHKALKNNGIENDLAISGEAALELLEVNKYDLILLDIMLPKIDGYTVCEMIRRESDIPIILLTALDSEEAQIKGFDTLADDYITKPFSIRLVLKRVEALLRRTSAETESTDDEIRYRDLTLSETERRVTVSGSEVTLTHLEFDILLLLLKNKGRVFSRDDLLNLVWGYDFAGYEKGVNFHIMNLRKKLKADYIETVRGVGYRIAKEDQKQP